MTLNMIRLEITDFLHCIKNDRVTVTAGATLLVLIAAIVLSYSISSAASQKSELAATIAYELGLSREGSFSEQVNQGIAFFASAMFFLAFLEYRSWNLLSLAALLAFIWFDDAARYHERIGGFLVSKFEFAAVLGLRPQDTGELLAWSLAAAALSALFILSYWRRRPGDWGILMSVLAAFLLLVFFGVVIDFLHILVPPNVELLVGVLEDGGEMLAVALIAICSIGVVRNADAYFEICNRRSMARSRAP